MTCVLHNILLCAAESLESSEWPRRVQVKCIEGAIARIYTRYPFYDHVITATIL